NETNPSADISSVKPKCRIAKSADAAVSATLSDSAVEPIFIGPPPGHKPCTSYRVLRRASFREAFMARDLIDLLWREHPDAPTGGSRGPKAKVTTSSAVDAAVTVADAEGL